MRRLYLCLLLCLSALPARATVPLRLCFEDVAQAPWTMPDGTGLNLELLHRVAQLTGEHFVFQAKPWSRCIEEVRAGATDAVIGTADTPERRQVGKLPTLPDGQGDASAAVNEESYYVFLRPGSNANWDGKAFGHFQGAIVVPRGYYFVGALKAQGYKVDETIKSAEEGLRLVAEGLADIAILYGEEASTLARSQRFRGKVAKAAKPYVTLPFFLMFSHQAYDQNPKRVQAIWDGIRTVRATAEYREQEAQGRRRAGSTP